MMTPQGERELLNKFRLLILNINDKKSINLLKYGDIFCFELNDQLANISTLDSLNKFISTAFRNASKFVGGYKDNYKLVR